MGLTNNEFGRIHVFVCRRMKLSRRQHTLYPACGSLLTELHLHDSMVNWLSRYLSANHIELPMRNFEVSRRVFVLCDAYNQRYAACIIESVNHTSVAFFLTTVGAVSVDFVLGRFSWLTAASNTLCWPCFSCSLLFFSSAESAFLGFGANFS
jgi:hypothetical protein